MVKFPSAAVLAVTIAMFAAPSARAELMIAPTRVVLDAKEHSAELVLVNNGSETAAFRVSVENRRMRLDGALEAADAPQADELFAADKVRFSPRQLVLGPGERQTIHVSANGVGALAPGEYRAHLRLMSAPVAEAKAPDPAQANDRELGIQLIAIRSLTIPVLLRVGKLDASVSLEGAGFAQAEDGTLVVHMIRQGTRSAYGDLRFTVQGDAKPAYFVRGVAVYVPNHARDVLIPLPKDVRARFAGKSVRIDYVSTDPAAPGTVTSTTVRL